MTYQSRLHRSSRPVLILIRYQRGLTVIPAEMKSWQPITESEFQLLLDSQLADLLPHQRAELERRRCPTRKVKIRRSDVYGDEFVYVIAEVNGALLYFDDVEYGWNFSPLNADAYIAEPGASQAMLRELFKD